MWFGLRLMSTGKIQYEKCPCERRDVVTCEPAPRVTLQQKISEPQVPHIYENPKKGVRQKYSVTILFEHIDSISQLYIGLFERVD